MAKRLAVLTAHLVAALAGGLILGSSGCSSDTMQGAADLAVAGSADLAAAGSADLAVAPGSLMSFFISSDTGSGNLGGLAGADARCTRLAEAAGFLGKKWAAYLSARGGGATPSVNARDRIGKGPWYNVNGVKIADDVAGLHNMATVNLNKQTALTEKGQVVTGRGDTPNQHDILTGSELDGTVTMASTCADWTSEIDTVMATVGHHDRDGGGTNPMSWNSAHVSRGCSAQALVMTGGAGRIYCFALQ